MISTSTTMSSPRPGMMDYQIDSGYLQTGNGVLELELGDTVPVDGHDVLSVGGTAVLGVD